MMSIWKYCDVESDGNDDLEMMSVGSIGGE